MCVMDSDPWKAFGKVLGDSFRIYYSWAAILVAVITAAVVMTVLYLKKRKQPKDEGSHDQPDGRKYVSWRIGIFVLIGMAVLISAPFVMGLFL